MNHPSDTTTAAEVQLSPLERQCCQIRDNDPAMDRIDLVLSSRYELSDNAKTHQLCEALANNTHLRHLAVDIHAMWVQGAAEFAETLAKSKLVSIDLQGHFVAVEIKHPLFRMLASEALKLEKLRIGAALTEEDVILLYECLKERRLAKFELYLPYFPTSLSMQAALDLSKIVARSKKVVITEDINPTIQRVLFRDGIQASDHVVQSLDLRSGRLEDMTGLVASLSKLSQLRLNAYRGLTVDFHRLCAGLSQATHLSLLELKQCNLRDHEITILAGALRDNHSITTLDLGHNSISDVGVAALVENWHEASPLKNLVLSGNRDISPHGVRLLLSAVAVLHDDGTANKKTLESLQITYAYGGFGYAGLQTLAQEVLPHARVRNLDLINCAFLNDNSPAIVLARKNASEAVLQAVQRNMYLHQVRFEVKELTPDVEKAMSWQQTGMVDIC